MKKIYLYLSLLAVVLSFSACSSKEISLSNKSAEFWYQKIITEIASSRVSNADDAYSSLYSEHVGSPYLAKSMVLLSKAHAYYDELILSKYYLKEYLKRFGTEQQREYIEYLKVKIAFMAYKHPFRNQKFLDETIASVNKFRLNYPQSTYMPLVSQMLLRLELGRDSLKTEIVGLYERVKKPKAAEYYRKKDRFKGVDLKDVKLPERSWIRSIFE
jgi:outer membrane protein assembly factor BamD